jgi:NADP-dependent 3-hydroxy acid dehydrogenase YdfG
VQVELLSVVLFLIFHIFNFAKSHSGRRKEKLEEAKQLIEKKYSTVKVFFDTCMIIPCLCLINFEGDIRDSNSVDEFVQKVKNEFGTLDILVNNAGGQFPINAESLSSKGFEG